MPKKPANKRTFREWFFGIEKAQHATAKKKAISKKKESVKGKQQKMHPRPMKGKHANLNKPSEKDIQSYISDAMDRLPSELAASQAEHEIATMSPELARKHESIKRRHLKIGVIAFATLVGVVWVWNMVISITQLGSASSTSFEEAKQRAAEINEQVSQTLDEKMK